MKQDFEKQEFYDWIEEYDYNDLTAEKQQQVDQLIEKQAYEDMREAFIETNSYFDKGLMIDVDSSVKEKLIDKMDQNIFKQIIYYKLSVYKVAGIIILVFISGWLLDRPAQIEVVSHHIHTDTIWQNVIDTVEVMIYDTLSIPQKSIVAQRKSDASEVESPGNKLTNSGFGNMPERLQAISPEESVKLIRNSTGYSLKEEDSLLSDFFVTIN